MERQVLTSEPDEAAALYRALSRHPALVSAGLGAEITSQYGGKYRTVHAEWTQRDLDRMESIRFCRQYLVFHDGGSVVFSGPAGNSIETKGE